MSSSYEVGVDSKIVIPSMVYYTQTIHHEPYEKISPLRPELSARGQNVVVTGGGTGIGKAIAIEFARAGARSISILGRREDRLKSAVGEITDAAMSISPSYTIMYQVTDLTKRSEVEKSLENIFEKVGKIDILISNAAVLPPIGPAANFDSDEMMRGFTNNVMSTFNIVQAFLTLASSNPAIINISSAIAHMAPMPGMSGYAVAKAATLKMMDYIAKENPHVHVVNLQPGGVETEMSQQVKVKGIDSPQLPGQFCVWLVSPEARFLRGRFVWSNWDVEELLLEAKEIENSRRFTWLLDGVPM